MLRLGMLPFACSGMLFKDVSSGALRLRRRREDDYCRVQPTSVCRFGAVSSGRCGAAELRARMSPLMRMAAERAEHEQVRARMPLPPRRCRVWRGLGHCVLYSVDVLLGRHVKWGFVERRRHGASSLRALAVAMRIARKRNRSPQNGAGRDDGSSQCSLL